MTMALIDEVRPQHNANDSENEADNSIPAGGGCYREGSSTPDQGDLERCRAAAQVLMLGAMRSAQGVNSAEPGALGQSRAEDKPLTAPVSEGA